jgi:hypothetical protein
MCFLPSVGAFSAFNARLRRREQGNSAERPQYMRILFAASMGASQLALKPQRGENVVPVPGSFMARRQPSTAKSAATPEHAWLRWNQSGMH